MLGVGKSEAAFIDFLATWGQAEQADPLKVEDKFELTPLPALLSILSCLARIHRFTVLQICCETNMDNKDP